MTKREVKTRRMKAQEGFVKPTPKEKFMQSVLEVDALRTANVPKYVPVTEPLKQGVAFLRQGVRVLALLGSAGTGKSMLAAWWASGLMREKKIGKIILVRPNVPTGRSAGSLPGTEFEKLEPFFVQTLEHLSTFMGAGYMHHCLDHDEIQLKSGEYLRGRSFENVCVIVEEAQNFDASDLEMVLTRLGKNCTIILTGDTKQNDLKGKSGLQGTMDLINKTIDAAPDYLNDEDLDNLENLIGYVEFFPEHCVRDGLTRAFVKMYYNN